MRTSSRQGISPSQRRDRARARPLLGATLLVAYLCLSAAGAAQEEGHAYGGEVVAHEGWYTEQQAERGEEAYALHCARCHHVDLSGAIGLTPPLVGPEFLGRWEGASVHHLFHWVRTMMPLDAPSTLHDETYLDILAYVLEANGFPPGEAELRPSADQLSNLAFPETPEEADVPESDVPGSDVPSDGSDDAPDAD